MNLVGKLRKLMKGNRPTEQEINKMQKTQQAQARERADEVVAVLMEIPYMDMTLLNESEKTETYRELSKALQVALYNAPVMRIDTEEIDEHMLYAAKCFREAIDKGDVYTADKSLMVLSNAITEIRQDVPETELAILTQKVNSKNVIMKTYRKVLEISKQRFASEMDLQKTLEDLQISNDKKNELAEKIRDIIKAHPEYMMELDSNNGELSPGATNLNMLMKKLESEKNNNHVLRDNREKFEGFISDFENQIQSLMVTIPFTEFVLDPNMARELEELNNEYVKHYLDLMKIMKDQNETVKKNWSRILAAIESTNDPVERHHALNFWREYEEQELEALKKRNEALRKQQNDSGVSGQIEQLKQENEQLEQLQNENEDFLTN